MLTDRQHGRLPPLLAEIVDVDRAIVATGGTARVVHIDDLRARRAQLAPLLERRAQLRGAAENLWGHRLAGDGPART